MIKLRDYQTDCVYAIHHNYKNNIKKQLVVMATGLGKTILAIYLSKKFSGKILFIVHKEELVFQTFKKYEEFFPMEVGIVKAQRNEIDKRIIIGSTQTLTNRLDSFKINEFDLVIIDECHHYSSKTFCKVAEYFEPKLRIGLTATPKRFDGLSLTNLFESIVFDYDISKGIKNGHLCQIDAFRIKTKVNISNVKKTAGDYNIKQLEEAVDTDARNQLIVDKYKEYADKRQAIAFCVDVQHAINLSRKFNDNGIPSTFIVADKELCPDRSARESLFKSEDIRVVTNVGVLTEGYDYPDVGCILQARPTQSETLYIQTIGRGTRLKSDRFLEKHGVKNCIILDFVDNSGKHNLINTFTLEDGKRIEDRVFISDERKAELIKNREEKERRITKMRNDILKDQKVNLFKVPQLSFYTGKVMLEPATEKQINYMKSLGIWEDGIEYTKLMASELISTQPASDRQIARLKKEGYDISERITLGQAQMAFKEIEARQEAANKIINKAMMKIEKDKKDIF